MLRKKSAWLSLLLVLMLIVSACSRSSTGGETKPPETNTPPTTNNPAPSGPKILTIGMWSAPDSFNSITNKTSYGTLVISVVYPSLYALTPKLEYEPRLASSYTMNPEQTEFTFKLNPNAKWTDGKPITAEDVAYTFQVIAHPDTPTSRRSLIDTIKGLDAAGVSETKDFNVSGIQVVDAQTIKFTTKKPVDVDAFMEKVASGIYIMPKHMLEPFVKADLKGLDKSEITMKPTVFGGPYKLVQYVTDQHVELAPNENYFLGKPKLDKLFYKIVGQATFAAALEKGEIDVASGNGVGEVPIADWEKVSSLSTLTPITYVAPSYQYLDINVALPEFSNPKVRQAIAHAINRPLIVQRLLKGQGEVLNTPINSANKYYNKDIQSQLAYDPAKAKKMLQDAGWDFNKEITLLTPTGNVVREQSADIIMANLQEAGMKVKIEKVDFPTRQARSAKGEFQLSLVGFSATFDPDISAQTSSTGAFNDRKYKNAKMDELLAKGKEIVKFEQKKPHYDQIQQHFIDEMPFIPLYAVKALAAVNKRVVNAAPNPAGLTWNAHTWDVK
ncbi:MAG TPA: ABC transporter substrate-binding protein [Symbiobacteriaceae bacterium]|jgi:peptide/nickel transport system substrate-binding protein|nr:ABC transporter substrate-binding protein [Symbiobacteriaceae bacterium]